jgi:hypothetical protein
MVVAVAHRCVIARSRFDPKDGRDRAGKRGRAENFAVGPKKAGIVFWPALAVGEGGGAGEAGISGPTSGRNEFWRSAVIMDTLDAGKGRA